MIRKKDKNFCGKNQKVKGKTSEREGKKRESKKQKEKRYKNKIEGNWWEIGNGKKDEKNEKYKIGEKMRMITLLKGEWRKKYFKRETKHRDHLFGRSIFHVKMTF